MTAVNPVFTPAIYNYHELRLGLLSDGEVLLDNVSVVEDPTGAARELMQNGAFSLGETKWRLVGNHSHSEVIVDPNNPANKVLRLIATGPTSYLNNRTETTLRYNGQLVPVQAGTEYQISFDAKWITGSRQVHTELYYNKVAETTILAMPDRHGTPGTKNSVVAEPDVADANIGPTYTGMAHAPVVPAAGEDITVSVTAADPDAVAAMILWYSVSGGTWQSVPMAPADAGLYSGTIPGQSGLSTVIQFYVEGTDLAEPGAAYGT